MPKDFRCQACGAEFDSKEQLDAHNRSAHPVKTGTATPSGAKKT